jgi:hypothetical protein
VKDVGSAALPSLAECALSEVGVFDVKLPKNAPFRGHARRLFRFVITPFQVARREVFAQSPTAGRSVNRSHDAGMTPANRELH